MSHLNFYYVCVFCSILCLCITAFAYTSHREATFTLDVGVVGITLVTEWAYLTSLSEGEHKVWASGPQSEEGVGLRPTPQNTVK